MGGAGECRQEEGLLRGHGGRLVLVIGKLPLPLSPLSDPRTVHHILNVRINPTTRQTESNVYTLLDM